MVSHLLLTYSEHLGANDHRAAITELMPVSCEVRPFPLLTLVGEPSPHVAPIIARAEAAS